jgi:hypothetical protein
MSPASPYGRSAQVIEVRGRRVLGPSPSIHREFIGIRNNAGAQSAGEARLERAAAHNRPSKGGSLKHFVELISLTMIGVFAAVFLMGVDRVVDVPCGQDPDATVNADDPTIGARFQLEGGCTSPYTVDAALLLKDGDEIAGPAGTFVGRGPAFDPQPTVTLQGSTGVANVIRA